jgi:hypothetical protein
LAVRVNVLQDYTFEIKYRPGTRMTHVDTFSRYPVADIEVNNADLTESDWLVSAQLQDEQLKRIGNILESKIKNETRHRQYFEPQIIFSNVPAEGQQRSLRTNGLQLNSSSYR